MVVQVIGELAGLSRKYARWDKNTMLQHIKCLWSYIYCLLSNGEVNVSGLKKKKKKKKHFSMADAFQK